MDHNILSESEIINEIFRKAAKDPIFRDKIISTPEVIVEQYNLSDITKKLIVRALKG